MWCNLDDVRGDSALVLKVREQRAHPGLTVPEVAALVGGYFAVRGLNLWQLWVASRYQSASGPQNPLGTVFEYFVHTPTPASPGLEGVLANWDGQWYSRIAVEGYPRGEEIKSDNDAWSWAFPPLFPLLVRLVMSISSLDFAISAAILNIALGLLATLLLFNTLRTFLSSRLAALGALSLSAFPLAPLFVVAYSEPMALVAILLCLRLIIAQRYALAIFCVGFLALTRPIAAPMAIVFLAHWANRWRIRNVDTVMRRDHAWLLLGVIFSTLSPWIWPLTASVLAGTTSASIRYAGSGRASRMLETFNFGWVSGIWRSGGAAWAAVLVAVVCGTLGFLLYAAWRTRLPLELSAWGAAYSLFIILVTTVTPGILRYLFLAAPLLIAVPILACMSRPRGLGALAYAGLFTAGLWGQWLWLRYLYIVDPAPTQLPWSP